ncbi:diacylglycerol/lipid kinase family protein [Paludisphaera mucosa]|uniref:Diacylglycerol kinase family protein n=1 Tax=Paludisphaera mucosa TaxID=3030827 RepID=A0ABT6FA41_9BACT|nr:diacylglycerol kinase family protein [Paludisphaera mucosa]MDG3004463.1 diacylglycerol kinase family protein [Paludisphaera mucosa]
MTHLDDEPPDDAPSPGPRGGWVGVVANPASGSGASRRKAERLMTALRDDHGLDAEAAWTPAERTALVARADADPSCRCLVAVGGDGTVSALINEKPRTPISVLRAGTENLAARHFQVGVDAEGLARTIAAGKAVPVDVGLANGRRFLLMTGFGFDGDVVTRHHGMRTATGVLRTTHRAAYVEPILRSSFSYRFPSIAVRVEDPGAEETLVGTTVFVFNLPRYALNLPFAPSARQDDGLLDLVVFRDPGPFQALYYLWRVVLGTHLKLSGVYHRRVRKVSLSARGAVPVQIDGDPGGRLLPITPAHARPDATARDAPTTRDLWSIEVLPRALRVLVDPAWSPGARPAALAGGGLFR